MKDKKLIAIERVLIEADPVALIKMGAPLDEYEDEAQLIYEHINRYFSLDKVHQTIYDIFVSRFGGGTAYKMVNGELIPIKEIKSSVERAKKIIGELESYKEIAEKVKAIIGDKVVTAPWHAFFKIYIPW